MKNYLILVTLLVLTIILSGCSKDSTKHEEESKNENSLNSISCTISDSNNS